MIIDLVSFAAFVVTVCVVWLIARMLVRLHHDPIRERLAGVTAGTIDSPHNPLVGETLIISLAGQLPQVAFDNGELDKDLRRAGYYKPTARQEFLALRNALVILAAIMTGVLAVVLGPERQDLVVQILGIGFIVALCCWGLPRVLLAVQARNRVQRIRRALPDVLDMISMCLHGGLPLQDVLGYVSREIFYAHYDLAVELLIVRHQTEFNSLEFAFQQFSQRIDATETTALATLINHNQRLGTNVAKTIQEYADSMREKRRQSADEWSGKVQLAALFPVILCLLPAAMMLLWGPAAVELWNFFQGINGPVSLGQ